MAFYQTSSGKVVEIDDNASPEVLANAKKQFGITDSVANDAPTTRVAKRAAGMARKAPANTVTSDADAREAAGGGMGVMSHIMDAATFGLADKVGAGLKAVVKGGVNDITGNGPGIADTYNHERDVQKELYRRYDEAHPVASTVGDIAGAVVNPIGVEGRGALAATRAAAKAAGMTRVAARVGKVAEHVAASPLASAIGAGATQGALNAAGHTDSLEDLPSTVIEGGLAGGAVGGVLGGGTAIARKAVQTIKDAGAKAATREAYSRVGNLLNKAGISPAQAEREIAVTDARGGDAMVQDLTPGLRAKAGNLSTLPDIKGSNELIERGEQRIADRRAKFGDAVRNTADIPAGGDDALARGDAIKAGRKAQGQADYASGGVMDTAITPTLELQKYLRDAPKEVQAALRSANDEMLLRDETPANFVQRKDAVNNKPYVSDDGINKNPPGVPGQENTDIFNHIPSLRTFDYVKRGFDRQIGQAIRSGDNATAQGLSYQLDKLKGHLADANPNNAEYQQILSTQRDAFQKQKALDLGQNVMARLKSQPRLVLRDLQALQDHQIPDARIGIIDALINSDTKADPVNNFRSIMRNDSQRKVMEFAFGGKGNLGRFERWVNRENRAASVDRTTAVGRQSHTARYANAGDTGEDSPTGQVLMAGFRGFGFGGVTGLVGNASRALGRLATGTGKVTQEEIAKVLLSKGEGLAKGIQAAKDFSERRAGRNRTIATLVAKGGQQEVTNDVGAQ